MFRGLKFALLICLVWSALPTHADDITGADRILCTVISMTECRPDAGCVQGSLLDNNVPRFIEIDLSKQTMSTTKASGLNRSTKIKNHEDDSGLTILQGYENGRAFSFVITNENGFASISVAVDDGTVTGFGECTPLGHK